MRRNILFAGLLSVGAVTLLIAQTQPPGQPPQPGQPVANLEMQAKYLEASTQCNLFEIELGRIAQTKAQRQDVKEFGRMMVDAHTRMNQHIKEVALKKNVQVPSQMMQWQQALIDECNKKAGEYFDHAYMFGQVGGHHTALLHNRCAANKSQDPEIKGLAQRFVPEIQQHLSKAESISNQLVTAGPERRVTGTGDEESGTRIP